MSETETDIVEIMEDMASDQPNSVGDKWGIFWCGDAAREIRALRAALSAAEGVKPRTITVSDRLAEELKTWAEDERASWPTDTAYQDDLADLVSQISALQEGE